MFFNELPHEKTTVSVMDRGGEKERVNGVRENRVGGRRRGKGKDVWDVERDGGRGWRGENRRMEVEKKRERKQFRKEMRRVKKRKVVDRELRKEGQK